MSEEDSLKERIRTIGRILGFGTGEQDGRKSQSPDSNAQEGKPTPIDEPASNEGAEFKEQTTKQTNAKKRNETMAMNIDALSDVSGFIGACLVDSDTGLMLGSVGGGKLDLEAAGAANTSVVQAKLAAIQALGLNDKIEDILITLGKQFHLIRPLEDSPTVFLYLALDKKSSNLGMARIQLKKVEQTLEL